MAGSGAAVGGDRSRGMTRGWYRSRGMTRDLESPVRFVLWFAVRLDWWALWLQVLRYSAEVLHLSGVSLCVGWSSLTRGWVGGVFEARCSLKVQKAL
jgi:hypothetical protein